MFRDKGWDWRHMESDRNGGGAFREERYPQEWKWARELGKV